MTSKWSSTYAIIVTIHTSNKEDPSPPLTPHARITGKQILCPVWFRFHKTGDDDANEADDDYRKAKMCPVHIS